MYFVGMSNKKGFLGCKKQLFHYSEKIILEHPNQNPDLNQIQNLDNDLKMDLTNAVNES